MLFDKQEKALPGEQDVFGYEPLAVVGIGDIIDYLRVMVEDCAIADKKQFPVAYIERERIGQLIPS